MFLTAKKRENIDAEEQCPTVSQMNIMKFLKNYNIFRNFGAKVRVTKSN